MPILKPPFELAEHIASWLQPQRALRLADTLRGRAVIEAAARCLAPAHGLDAPLVFDALWRREQAASTALGRGCAVPHARIGGVARPSTLYVRTDVPVAFDAPDGLPVSDFLVVLVPRDGADDDYLRLLAAIARLFGDRRFRRQLHDADTSAASIDVFRNAITRVFDRPS